MWIIHFTRLTNNHIRNKTSKCLQIIHGLYLVAGVLEWIIYKIKIEINISNSFNLQTWQCKIFQNYVLCQILVNCFLSSLCMFSQSPPEGINFDCFFINYTSQAVEFEITENKVSFTIKNVEVSRFWFVKKTTGDWLKKVRTVVLKIIELC